MGGKGPCRCGVTRLLQEELQAELHPIAGLCRGEPGTRAEKSAVAAADMDLIGTGSVGTDGRYPELVVGLYRRNGEDRRGTHRRRVWPYGSSQNCQVVHIVHVSFGLEIECQTVDDVGGGGRPTAGARSKKCSRCVKDAQIPVAGGIRVHVNRGLAGTVGRDDRITGGLEAIDDAGGSSLIRKLCVDGKGGERSGVAGITSLLEIEGHAVRDPIAGIERMRTGSAAHQTGRGTASASVVSAGGVGMDGDLVKARGGLNRVVRRRKVVDSAACGRSLHDELQCCQLPYEHRLLQQCRDHHWLQPPSLPGS